jgi:hypothetical protein
MYVCCDHWHAYAECAGRGLRTRTPEGGTVTALRDNVGARDDHNDEDVRTIRDSRSGKAVRPPEIAAFQLHFYSQLAVHVHRLAQ